MRFECWPLGMANHDDGDLAVLQVLLVSKILVCCNEGIVPSLFSGSQQFADAQAIPFQVN